MTIEEIQEKAVIESILEHHCEECERAEEMEELLEIDTPILDDFFQVHVREDDDTHVPVFYKVGFYLHSKMVEAEDKAEAEKQEKEAKKLKRDYEKNRIRSVIKNYLSVYNNHRINSYFAVDLYGRFIRERHRPH